MPIEPLFRFGMQIIHILCKSVRVIGELMQHQHTGGFVFPIQFGLHTLVGKAFEQDFFSFGTAALAHIVIHQRNNGFSRHCRKVGILNQLMIHRDYLGKRIAVLRHNVIHLILIVCV